MIRLLATKSADPRFKNVHSLGIGSYIGRTRDILCEARASATVVSPWIDQEGIKLLLESWEERNSKDVEWNIFVRQVDRPLALAARGKPWHLFQYKRTPNSGVSPFGMHAKIVLADGEKATVGSMNLLKASLYSNLEVGVDIRDRVVARQLFRLSQWLGSVSIEE